VATDEPLPEMKEMLLHISTQEHTFHKLGHVLCGVRLRSHVSTSHEPQLDANM